MRTWCARRTTFPIALLLAVMAFPRDCLQGRSCALLAQAEFSQQPQQPQPSQPPQRRQARQVWQRVSVPDPVARLAIQRALDDAWQWLTRPQCRAVLTGFRDISGDPLERRLRFLSVDPQTYITLLLFIDGSREAACVDGVFAFTAPRSRVVRLCVEEVKRTSAISSRLATAYFIHEMLHTLGLGENPPSSKEINQRVLTACAPEE